MTPTVSENEFIVHLC